MRNRLLKLAEEKPETLDEKCIEVENVFNLITKEKYWQKPSYKSLEESLLEMKEKLSKNKNIKKLVMPKIETLLILMYKDNQQVLELETKSF